VVVTDDRPVILGRVSGLFGVKGWVKVHSYTDPREAILNYPDWLIELGGRWQPQKVEEGKQHGKTVIARFEGVQDRDAAVEYMNARIGVQRDSLPQTGDGEYYWSDLEGLSVVRKDGNVLGKVAYLLETGANDVLVVQEGDREVLIPFVTGDVVKEVDLAKGEISVDWEWD
jgi:16S rRNA processing protein RimM